jgi:hypothetical protein
LTLSGVIAKKFKISEAAHMPKVAVTLTTDP